MVFLLLLLLLIDGEEIARISSFCRLAEIDFHRLARSRNVTFD